MDLNYSDFQINGPILINTAQHFDERGFFAETYQSYNYGKLGLPDFVQDNVSLSSRGVFRGLHWQEAPYEQGKLVTCLQGSIVDFFVDVRPGSSTFLEHHAVPLNSMNLQSLWIPAGFAHGFLSLQDNTLVSYKVTNFWNKDSERSLSFSRLNLSEWISPELLKVSGKDLAAPESLD